LSATFTPEDSTDYAMVTATTTITVDQAAPVVTWRGPAAITYGTALGRAQLDAKAWLPSCGHHGPGHGRAGRPGCGRPGRCRAKGTFAYSPPAGTVLGAGEHTLSVTFTPDDSTDYATATATTTITVDKATAVVTWPRPRAVTYGTALGPSQLDATASVPGTFSYGPPAGTVLVPGEQTLSVTFTPTDGTDYRPVTATTTVTVGFTRACMTTTLSGPLDVGRGQAVCIASGGKVTGAVSVSAGGALWVDGGAVGSLGSSGALAVELTGATVAGPVSVTGSSGPVVVDGSTVSGSVSVKGNTGGVSFTGSTVSGSLVMTGNSGGFHCSGNKVKGPVTSSGNT